MATYYVSLMITPPRGFDDAQVDNLLREAIDVSTCFAITVSPTGLVVEAEEESIQMLEPAIREALEGAGGELNSITVADNA